MATEEASVPREKVVELSDGRKIKCCRIKTATMIRVSNVLRAHGIGLADLWTPTGHVVTKPLLDDDGKAQLDGDGKAIMVEDQIALPGKGIWSVPEIALTVVCASTGLTWDEVEDLEIEDTAKLTGAVMELVDLKGAMEALKNSFGLVKGMVTSQMSGSATPGSKT